MEKPLKAAIEDNITDLKGVMLGLGDLESKLTGTCIDGARFHSYLEELRKIAKQLTENLAEIPEEKAKK